MKYITTETAEDIRNAMTMAAITTTYDLFPNLSQVNHEHIARMVDSAFETWCQIEDIKVVETDEPETGDYDSSQWDDDCDYEVGYDPTWDALRMMCKEAHYNEKRNFFLS